MGKIKFIGNVNKLKFYIYRPDMAKINPNLLYTPKGRPFFEDRDREKELEDRVEDLKEEIRWKKNKPFKIIL